jgi:hypothetical protein
LGPVVVLHDEDILGENRGGGREQGETENPEFHGVGKDHGGSRPIDQQNFSPAHRFFCGAAVRKTANRRAMDLGGCRSPKHGSGEV